MSTIWLLAGTAENWITGIGRKYWGLNTHNKTLWGKINKGDIGIFHSIKKSARYYDLDPVIIGYAIIGEKRSRKDSLWWDDEKITMKNKWPYVFSFNEIYLRGKALQIDYSQTANLLDVFKVNGLLKSGVKFGEFRKKTQKLYPSIRKFMDQKSIQEIDHEYYDYIHGLDFEKLVQ